MCPSDEAAQREGDGGGDDRADTWERFAARLVDYDVIEADEVEELLGEARTSKQSLPEILLQRDRCGQAELREQLTAFFGVEAVAGEDIPLDPALMVHFPGDLLLRLGAVPLTLVGASLRVAMVDPSDQRAVKTLRGLVFASIWPVVALERDVRAALERVGARGRDADAGDSAFLDAVQRAGEAIAAGRPDDAITALAPVIAAEPAGGTDGGRRLSFATVDEQQAFADEQPDREVEWIDPAFGFAHYLRGVALGDLDRLAEADRELELAVEWNPVSDRAHLELGWLRARRGRHEAAITAYARAAALAESDRAMSAAQAHRGRGYCLAALGRTAEALAAYRRSLELDAASEIARDAVAGLEQPAAPTPAPATDVVARLAAATAAGTLAWRPAEVDDPDERGFTCDDGGRTITISRRGKRYRLAVQEGAAAAGGESAARVEEEQDGLLRRSRSLKPLFEAVARRTRVLER